MRYTHQSSTNEDISMHHAVIIRFLIKKREQAYLYKGYTKSICHA